MVFFIFIICLYIFIKTVSYALYEIKSKNNKFGGVCVILIATVSLFLPAFMFSIR